MKTLEKIREEIREIEETASSVRHSDLSRTEKREILEELKRIMRRLKKDESREIAIFNEDVFYGQVPTELLRDPNTQLQTKLPGKPDMIFHRKKKVIFMHGCFWHQHTDDNCKTTRMPKSNLEFWLPKLERTKKRDAENLKKLKEMGLDYLIIWESQIRNKDKNKKAVRFFLDS